MEVETKVVTIISWHQLPEKVRKLIEIKAVGIYQELYLDFYSVQDMKTAYKDDSLSAIDQGFLEYQLFSFDEWLKDGGFEDNYELLKLFPEDSFHPNRLILLDVS